MAAAAVLLSVLTIMIATNGLSDLVFAQEEAKFMINLTGSEEVPSVQTNAIGKAEISAFDIASDSISYAINVPGVRVQQQVIRVLVNKAKIDP